MPSLIRSDIFSALDQYWEQFDKAKASWSMEPSKNGSKAFEEWIEEILSNLLKSNTVQQHEHDETLMFGLWNLLNT